MVVDEEVASALREQRVDAAIFVARCAERMVQVFTGLREDDPDRSSDLGAAVSAVDDLWQSDVADDVFRVHLDVIMRFMEMVPSDEELEGMREVYSAYSVLALRYALRYRANGDIEDAIRCAHVNLTAMGQLDRNLENGSFFADEQRKELEAVRSGDADNDIAKMRRIDQETSRARLNALRRRLTA